MTSPRNYELHNEALGCVTALRSSEYLLYIGVLAKLAARRNTTITADINERQKGTSSGHYGQDAKECTLLNQYGRDDSSMIKRQ